MKEVFDKNGHPIQPFAVLKVFHFVGSRRKKYYMYKRAKMKDGELFAEHLESDDGSGYWLWPHRRTDNHRLYETEVVQCYGPCCCEWKRQSEKEGAEK